MCEYIHVRCILLLIVEPMRIRTGGITMAIIGSVRRGVLRGPVTVGMLRRRDVGGRNTRVWAGKGSDWRWPHDVSGCGVIREASVTHGGSDGGMVILLLASS